MRLLTGIILPEEEALNRRAIRRGEWAKARIEDPEWAQQCDDDRLAQWAREEPQRSADDAGRDTTDDSASAKSESSDE